MTSSSSTSTAAVATGRPARYGKQLVAHLGRHHGGEWSDESATGWIVLGAGRASVSAVDGSLVLAVEGADAALPDLEDVLGRHLVRFGTKDELQVQWVRADGSAGTRQPVSGD